MSKKEMNLFYKEHGDSLIELRKSGMMVKDIAELYNINEHTLSGFFARNCVLVRKKLSADDENDIVARYLKGETPDLLSKEYHVTSAKIPEIVRAHGYVPRDLSMAKRVYSVNDKYFDAIDTPNKAYILGLLIADGSRHSIGHSISISLQESDKSILEKIKKELESDYPIKFRNLSAKNPNYSNQYFFMFSSKRICESLEKYHIVPKKDFKTAFPKDIDKQLYKDVIRGLLDGDGTIFKSECRCGITGNRELICYIAEYVQSELDIHCSVIQSRKNTSTCDFRIAGRKQVKKFLDYIYTDAELYIQRKYDIYKSLYCNHNDLSLAS